MSAACGGSVRAIDGREVVVSRTPAGEWFAYEDKYGVDSPSLYGYGESEIEAIENYINLILDHEAGWLAESPAKPTRSRGTP